MRSFDERFPALATWTQDHGWIEVGLEDLQALPVGHGTLTGEGRSANGIARLVTVLGSGEHPRES